MSYSSLILWLLGIVYFGACLWLILIILLQEGKGGGFGNDGSSAPGALSDSLGAGAAEKSLFNMTKYTAIVFFVLAIILTRFGNNPGNQGGVLDDLEDAPSQTELLGTTSEPLVVEGVPDPPAAPVKEDDTEE
jgi:protein translocase SecG subunit